MAVRDNNMAPRRLSSASRLWGGTRPDELRAGAGAGRAGRRPRPLPSGRDPPKLDGGGGPSRSDGGSSWPDGGSSSKFGGGPSSSSGGGPSSKSVGASLSMGSSPSPGGQISHSASLTASPIQAVDNQWPIPVENHETAVGILWVVGGQVGKRRCPGDELPDIHRLQWYTRCG